MKALIAYASKSGTTEKTAKMLASKLKEVECCNLSQGAPDICRYDAVIVGGPIRMGKLHKDVVTFIDRNRATLQKMPYGLFICCGFTDQAADELASVYDERLRSGAVAVASFGGELDFSKQKGPDKMIAKMAMKANPNAPVPAIDKEAIDAFARHFVSLSMSV